METPQIQMIRGFPFPNVPFFSKENIESTLDYTSKDGDVIIASYPKTGTTWLQYIVLQILTRGREFPSFHDLLNKTVPFMEMAGLGVIAAMPSPRVYKHHYPYNMVKKNDKAKVLYIYRNPEDTFVSFFHFMKQQFNNDESVATIDAYFELYMEGKVPFGRLFEHVQTYLDHEGDPNLLLVSYESLLERRREGVLRIAAFLGQEYHRSLVDDPGLLEGILERTSFEYMKRHLTLTLPLEGGKKIDFFRKGVIGDGKRTLSEEQKKRMSEETKRVMEGTSVLAEWLKE